MSITVNYNGFAINIPDGFYHILHTWERLESRSRYDEYDEGLQARVADPLWFIARQWQLGELQAEDAGSLVHVTIDHDVETVRRYSLGGTDTFKSLPGNTPLEVLVERERTKWDWRLRVRTGQQFERILSTRRASSDLVDRLYSDFAITAQDVESIKDQASKRIVRMVLGKALNGEALWNQRYSLGAEYSDAREELEAWFKDLCSRPAQSINPSWQSNTLDHKFAVETDRNTKLVSDAYRNGDLEWYTSNHQEDGDPDELSASLADAVTGRPEYVLGELPRPVVADPEQDSAVEAKITPTRVSFAGMPDPRWWVMEDRSINFGQLDTAQSELIKHMFQDFAIIHGDDWHVVPLNLPTASGSLTLINSITTTDVFGVEQTIDNGRINDPDPLERWDLFSLSKNETPEENADRDFLYIPPSSGFREESAPVEEVSFIRDEQANMVFAIEQTSGNDWGKPTSVYEYHLEIDRRAEEALLAVPDEINGISSGIVPQGVETTERPELTFKLATKVPKNWIPYLPVRVEADETHSQVLFKQARLPSVSDDVVSERQGVIPEPQTRILEESTEINEEAITRAGVKVQFTKQRLRWIDGKTYVWQGRKVVTGRGGGSSGLEFDVAQNRDSQLDSDNGS